VSDLNTRPEDHERVDAVRKPTSGSVLDAIQHILDLKLGISVDQVLIAQDGMAQVFDYDPLILEIDRLAADGHYETQERLITRIASACATHFSIKHMTISLRKSPVRAGSGSLGVCLTLDEIATEALREEGMLIGSK
jgi:dihydroneopterin aldolase